MNSDILFGILWIATVLLAWFYAKTTKKIETNDRLYMLFDRMYEWAEIVVRWVDDRLKDEDGNNKRTAAINALKEIRDKLGIEISDDQLGMLISAAYKNMVEFR